MPENRKQVGLILIDAPVPGESPLSGLSLPSGIVAHPFEWRAGEPPLPALQSLLQRVRRAFGGASILARGAGCMAALALSEQLPVERLALMEPDLRVDASLPLRLARDLRRLSAFAMRNLTLCVSDALILERKTTRLGRRIARGVACSGRAAHVAFPDKSGPELYTICENTFSEAIFAHLRGKELPKNLAENPELCIIYR